MVCGAERVARMRGGGAASGHDLPVEPVDQTAGKLPLAPRCCRRREIEPEALWLPNYDCATSPDPERHGRRMPCETRLFKRQSSR